ncbi:MAG: Gfo/Idh/MocA family oxidoreductase, partial [Verrucomicrobiota bacterium]
AGIPYSAARVFEDWRQLVGQPKLADVAVIAVQDALHAEVAVPLAGKGYHLLLEKPMATTEEDCRAIVEAVVEARVLMSVGHVLRYTPYTKKVKEVLDSGSIGELVSVQHLEPVGFWHQAHSFVRGNWGREADSTFMLLAKSCHDLDWLRYVMGHPWKQVSSFGGLHHFKADALPDGAGERCLECSIESTCPYSARRLYLDPVINDGKTGWPMSIVVPEGVTRAAVRDALEHGPYGRCVYRCDNDVVDHQVVNLQFANGATAVFTMTAFTESAPRKTRFFGTMGSLEGDGESLELYDFVKREGTPIEIDPPEAGMGLHGGGDFGVIDGLIEALRTGDSSSILSGPEVSLESHLLVFAAEKARLENRVIVAGS